MNNAPRIAARGIVRSKTRFFSVPDKVGRKSQIAAGAAVDPYIQRGCGDVEDPYDSIDLIRGQAADIEPAVGTETELSGSLQALAKGDGIIDVLPRCAVEARDA